MKYESEGGGLKIREEGASGNLTAGYEGQKKESYLNSRSILTDLAQI